MWAMRRAGRKDGRLAKIKTSHVLTECLPTTVVLVRSDSKHRRSVRDELMVFIIFEGFMTPEEFFLKEKPAKFEWRSINPEEVLKNLKPKEENDAAVSTQYHKKVRSNAIR
jgi:hypothetical protein